MAVIARYAFDPEAPLVDPPAGVEPNFVNPPNGNATMDAIASIDIALFVIILTLYLHSKTKLKLFLEDHLVLPATTAFIVYHVFVFRITSTTGYFVRGWNIQAKDQSWHLFNIYISTTMYNVTMIFLKTAILAQWARIFSPAKRDGFFWLCYLMASLNGIFYLATILIDLLYCMPVQYHWDKSIPNGHCGDDDLLSPLSAAINVLLDLSILLLPQKRIWNLNMTLKRKIGVSLVFCVGVLCIIFASVRLNFAVKLLYANDYAYDASFEILFGSLEMTYAFLTFALPAMPKALGILVQHTKAPLNKLGKSSKRLWTSVSSGGGSSRKPKKAAATPGSAFKDADADADERTLVPEGTKGSSSAESESTRKYEHVPMQNMQSILRTTSFNMSEDYDTDHASDFRGILPRHHPWQPLEDESKVPG